MTNKDMYSVKMRASMELGGVNKHISGAEKIVNESQLAGCVDALIARGLNHDKGKADFLNIKLELIKDQVLYLDALPVTTIEVDSYSEGLKKVEDFLKENHIGNISKIMDMLNETFAMRGAMLLDIRTLERLEEDHSRGIRATYMDLERDVSMVLANEKNHYMEAIVLATKVANCPGIVGEICISDDPGYVTGYVASRACGYRRITKLKEYGSENGGRIFLFDSTKASVDEAVEYLQKKRVIVRNVRPLSTEAGRKDPMELLKAITDDMKDKNLYRTMRRIEGAEGSHVTIDGRDYVMMASNSYLDITTHPKMLSYCHQILDEYGVGSGGSRLTTGNMDLHEQLEARIASFKGTESAIVFNTGYVANLATIFAIMKNGGVIFSDELNHASIIDGCRLSKAVVICYKHGDMEDLERKIVATKADFAMAVSDAVFSMDGDILNLPEFVRICKKHRVLSMIDEAHATGVIGKTGHGIVEHFANAYMPDIIMGTLSKSVGGEGGFVAGGQLLIDYLRNTARGFIFSTSLPLVTVAADIAGIDIIESEPELVARLHDNVEYFCKCLRDNGYACTSQTPIIPIIIGDEKKAMDVSNELMNKGYFISAIRYPTVAKGQARLRVAIMSSHTEDELKKAADLIAQYAKLS